VVKSCEPVKRFQPNLTQTFPIVGSLDLEGHELKSQGHRKHLPEMHFEIYLDMLLVVVQFWAQ